MAKNARWTPQLTGKRIIRALPVDSALLPHVGETLGNLADMWRWEEVGDDIDTITQEIQRSVEYWYSNMLIGMVSTFAVALPSGWLLLDGSTHDKADYPELWELLDASMKTANDFTLPDMVDAFTQGTDTIGGVGVTGGENGTNLTVGQLPAHTHNYIPSPISVTPGGAGPPLPSSAPGAPIATTPTGSGDAIENRPSFVAFQYAIFAGRE